MIFVDSNIWCYYFDKSAKEHRKVVGFLDKIIRKEKICVNTVVLMEVSHYLVKNLGPIKGNEKSKIFLSLPMKIIDFDYTMLEKSIGKLVENSHTGIGGRDATILAAMKNQNIKTLATHDKSFHKIEEIDVIDPA